MMNFRNIVIFVLSLLFIIVFQSKALKGQDLNKENVEKIMMEGITNMNEGNYRSAIELFDRGKDQLTRLATAIDEINADIARSLQLTRQAEALINRNDYEGALAILNQAIELDDNNIEAYKFRGSVRLVLEQLIDRPRNRDYLSLLNDYTNAIRIVDRRIQGSPRRSQERLELEKEKAKILINRAYVKMQFRRTSSFHSAIDDYTEAIRNDDQNWDGFFGRATAYNSINEPRREVTDYLKAAELIEKYNHPMTDNDWSDLYLKIALAYVNARDNRNAFIYAERAYNLGNRDAERVMERYRP